MSGAIISYFARAINGTLVVVFLKSLWITSDYVWLLSSGVARGSQFNIIMWYNLLIVKMKSFIDGLGLGNPFIVWAKTSVSSDQDLHCLYMH
jgi:hypothetical protein